MEINLERVAKLLKKNIVMIISVSMIFTIVACLISVFIIKPQFTTGSRFKIALNTEGAGNVDTITYTARLLSLVNEVTGSFDSDEFYTRISERVAGSGVDIKPDRIAKMLSIKLEGSDTSFFTISATASTAAQAKVISDAVAEEAVDYVSTLDRTYMLVLMKQGQLPKSQSSPNVLRNAAIGFILGAALCVGYIVLADMLDRRVKTTADLVERFGYPILGVVPRFSIEDSKESSDGKDGLK